MEPIEVSVDFGGRTLTLQTGKLAKQADASVLARYGETVVLVTVVSSKVLKAGQDFFPLTVDFQEKYYAAGRIPGGFFKREAKPSDRATLSARLIDRPTRPLFPEDYLCETNVVATVLSTDGKNESDILASIAASAALHISDIPWAGPIGTCRVGMLNGELVINPIPEEQPNSQLELLVSGVRSGVIMVEGSAKEVSEPQMMDAIDFAHQKMLPVMDMIDDLRKKVGKPKRDYEKPPKNEALKTQLRTFLWPSFEKAFAVREKLARYEALGELKDLAKSKFGVEEPKKDEDEVKNKLIGPYFEDLKATYARELTVNTKHRIDGRGYADIRPISCEAGLLPRVHGSALFTRGETQVLSTVTLGTSDDEQKIDSINGVYQKTFMLHYNFPPYSVGEARPLRPPGRREIGHGFLAERALAYVIPPNEQFPYTVRIVSEVLESNGSSSMATVCSGSLALMDAGIPIPKAVAGVAMGLIKEGNKIAVLSDILGDEDHLGDMDFKVCGTADGVTAFQMDLKIGGVSREIMEQALEQAKQGRLHILGKMNELLSQHRESFSVYAPRIFTMKVKPDKVREVIGSGGKTIRSIIERTGVKIDIEDDGSINIASMDSESAQKAIEIINQIVEEPEIGRIYEGKVTRIAEFGAFIEIIPGTDGLCHISELADYRVRRVEDILKEGDVVRVKCLDVDSQGKIRLSIKALLKEEGQKAAGGSTEGAATEGGEAGSPAREERPERGMREERGGDRPAAREERGERADRPDRPERTERSDRPERPEREVREPRGGRPEREEFRGGRPSRDERPPAPRDDRPERSDRGPRSGGIREDRDRGGRDDRGFGRDRDRGGDRGDRPPERSGGSDRPERSGGGDRPERSGGSGDRDRGGRGGDRGGRGGGGGGHRGGGIESRDRAPREGRFDRGGEREEAPRRERSSFDRDDNHGNRRDEHRGGSGGAHRSGGHYRGGGEDRPSSPSRSGGGRDRGRDENHGNFRDDQRDRRPGSHTREREDRGIHFDPEDGLMTPSRFRDDED